LQGQCNQGCDDEEAEPALALTSVVVVFHSMILEIWGCRPVLLFGALPNRAIL
jgi:hypothetical protein